jgi:hypothetical protein
MTDEHAAMKEFLSDHRGGDAAVAFRRAAVARPIDRGDLAILILDMADHAAPEILKGLEPQRTRVVSDMAFGVEPLNTIRAILEKLGREDLDTVMACLERPISKDEIHVIVRTDGRWFIRQRDLGSILHPAAGTAG